MNGSLSSNAVALVEPLLCLVALVLVLRNQRGTEFRFLLLFLGFRLCSAIVLLPLLIFAGHGLNAISAYNAYFYGFWISFSIETILSLLIIYSIFDLAMMPLEGIRKLGMLIFRWAACMSLVVAIGSVMFPHADEFGFIIGLVMELYRTVNILTLCLLLFVCFAIRPLGLSYKSRIFGISAGLGTLAITNLTTVAWIAHTRQVYSPGNFADGIATCTALIIWVGYFAIPEAKRRIVILPTTSPYLRWNQISQALGDAPGYVAISGVPPELFAPAEIEVMRRASLQMVG